MLVLWIPGIRDISNQGVSNIDVNNHNVTIDSGGKLGGCLNFNASNYQYLSMNTKVINSDTFTISMWIYPNGVSGAKCLMCCRNGANKAFAMYIINGRLRIDTGSNWATSLLSDTTWTHIAFVSNGTSQKLYVNGELANSQTATSDFTTVTEFTTIGAEHTNGNNIYNCFNGKLNDIRIYDEALSSTQIKDISKGMIVHYPFADYGFNKEYDISGFGNHATRNGNTFTSSSDTPRYTTSTHFTGTNYVSVTSPSSEVKTVSLWAKWDTIPSGQSVVFLDYKSKLGLGLMSQGILCTVSASTNARTFNKSNLVANTWYHFVVINDGDSSNVARKLYINGVQQENNSGSSKWTYAVDQLQIGKRNTTSDGFVGCISDFRAYTTVLSDDDILELYHTPITLSSDGTLMVYGEYVEG